MPELEKGYSRARYLTHCKKERDGMNCVQARMGLDGHTLAATGLCWRDDPNAPKEQAQILSGAQDQTISYYSMKKPSIKSFPKWTKGAIKVE